jgi:hypothetical protein
MQCDKNGYRGVLAGLEGLTGKKAVDSDAMTVKNQDSAGRRITVSAAGFRRKARNNRSRSAAE